MRRAFAGWTQTITMKKRVDVVVDGLVTHQDNSFSFQGTIQPLSAKTISLKPEGQRAWAWLQVHCFSSSVITDNDQIIYLGDLYKVMGVFDYRLNGFMEYHLVKDYQNG